MLHISVSALPSVPVPPVITALILKPNTILGKQIPKIIKSVHPFIYVLHEWGELHAQQYKNITSKGAGKLLNQFYTLKKHSYICN